MILPSFLSYISTYVSFENAKFGDDLSTLAEEDICRGRQSSRNGDFLIIITIFWANTLPEDNASDRAQPLLDDPHFFLPFQLPTSLYHTYLQRAKIGDLKERSQKHTVLLLY